MNNIMTQINVEGGAGNDPTKNNNRSLLDSVIYNPLGGNSINKSFTHKPHNVPSFLGLANSGYD